MTVMSIKSKGCDRNFVETISRNEYKDVLMGQICLRHLMKRIQNKNQRIGIYEKNKTSSSCFNDKIYIPIRMYIQIIRKQLF